MAETGTRDAAIPGAGASPPAVFVSYASADGATAEAVCRALEDAGVACWIAPRDVVPGEFYADAIVRAIDATQVIVLVLSKESAASHHVLREVERASSRRHPVISFRIDGSPLPASLEYFLNTSHWLDATATGVDRALPRLVEAVRRLRDAGVAASPTPGVPRVPAPRARWLPLLVGGAILGVGALGYFLAMRGPHRAPAAAAPAPPPAAIQAKSVVVMPFLDMSEKKDQEYFADGLAEELLNLLARVPELKVPSRSSSFFYKGKNERVADVARELGVANVLEGTVRKAGDTVRVSVELVRAADGSPLWSNIYDRDVRDIFKVQDEISAAVVEALKAKLTPAPAQIAERRSANPVAYDQYLLGVHLYGYGNTTRDDFLLSAAALRRSIDADPGFAPPYAALAMVEYLLDSDFADRPDPAVADRALAHANRAVALAPDLADAYSTRGFIRMYARRDWAGARADLDRALALDPNDGNAHRRLGFLASTTGQLDRFVTEERRATELDPLNVHSLDAYAAALTSVGRIAEAEAVIARIRTQNPQYANLTTLSSDVDLVANRPQKARDECAAAPPDAMALVCLAIAEQRLDNHERSQAALDALLKAQGDRRPYAIALAYAGRGEYDRALDWLARAKAKADRQLCLLRQDWEFAPLRGDPRFRALLHGLGLPE